MVVCCGGTILLGRIGDIINYIFYTDHLTGLSNRAYFDKYDGIIINPAAYTHTSVALLDAVKAVAIPTVEVHISDVTKREDFRQVSYVREACIGTVMGKGFDGYVEAMDLLLGGVR
jgi:3-dehydroquinate dehydratase